MSTITYVNNPFHQNEGNAAAFSQQSLAPILVQTWTIHDKEVRLLRVGDKLICKKVDLITKEEVDYPIKEIEGFTLQETESYLIERCDPVINHGQVDFSVPLKNWMLPNYSITLLQAPDSLVWQIFDQAMRKARHYPTSQYQEEPLEKRVSLLSALSANKILVDFSVPLKKWMLPNCIITLLQPLDSLVWQIFDQTTKEAYHYPTPQYQEEPLEKRVSLLSALSANEILNKLTVPSLFDRDIVIDVNSCALTLISTGREWHGHAAIAIEGIEKGIPYLWRAHLTGYPCSGTGKAEVLLEKKIRFRGAVSQTATWLRSKDRVQEIIKRVSWEIEQQEKGKPWVFFNKLGADSTLVSPVKVMESNIREFRSFMDTVPQREGYDVFNHGINEIDRLQANVLLTAVHNTNKIDRVLINGILGEPFANVLLGTPNENTENDKIYLGKSKTFFVKYKDKNERRDWKLKQDWESDFDADLAFREKNRIITAFVLPDNCITWARRLLTLADIHLQVDSVLYTTPVEYTKTKKGNELKDKSLSVLQLLDEIQKLIDIIQKPKPVKYTTAKPTDKLAELEKNLDEAKHRLLERMQEIATAVQKSKSVEQESEFIDELISMHRECQELNELHRMIVAMHSPNFQHLEDKTSFRKFLGTLFSGFKELWRA